MGKRKERRLAALSNAGRRVKLDLFAEPSGDLGGSTEHDEDRGDKDTNHRDGLPNSPNSSGQHPQNPLLLLGQYSDDEMDQEPSKELDHATVESSSPNDEVKNQHDEDYKDLVGDAGEDLSIQGVPQQEGEQESIPPNVSQNVEGSNKGDSDPTKLGDLQKEKEINLTEQNSVSATSETQAGTDVALGWKIVMHEESNRYYYWNTETGETSWEEPDVLAQAARLNNGQIIPTINEKAMIAPLGTDEPNIISAALLGDSSAAPPLEGAMDANMIPQGIEVYGNGYQMGDCSTTYENEAWKDSNWSTVANPTEVGASSEKLMHDMVATEGHESGFALSSHLVQRSECLLQRLKSLTGSGDYLQGHDCISNYILEVEIRLSDLKSLSSYGSSLLPFWVHSEKQLKQLESAVNNEISKIARSPHTDEVEANHVSALGGKGELQENIGYEPEKNGTESKGVLSTSQKSDITPCESASIVVQKVSDIKEPLVNAEYGSLIGSPSRVLSSSAGVSEQVGGDELGDEAIHKHVFNAAEDVDMDVDMEVEDTTSSGNTSTVVASNPSDFGQLEHPLHPSQPADYPSSVSEDGFPVPPPPDEEWIPPPPPDNEQIPPPPPDEPPEPSYPLLSYTEPGQPLSYPEQYGLSYLDSSFEYHVHSVAQAPSSNLYGHAEGSQAAVLHAPIYYETVPNSYTEAASVIVNPGQPVAYYGLQDGTVPPVPGVSGVESTGFQTEFASAGQVVSVDSFMGVAHNSSLNVNANVSVVSGEPDKANVEIPPASATVQAAATISVKDGISAPPTDPVAATSMGTKGQSKVLRSKKRTTAVAPSLRSNKKVSSLVDKWKAAKEELLEDEKEPEDAYEMLERKRQREIEEWRARQIASGEAKDNANFQPLGGDWRERVKRRRAQLAKESAKTPPEAHSDGKQQPDLVELSRNLPSGWQAYWDESSKQIYYGNSKTSETTWTRPTK